VSAAILFIVVIALAGLGFVVVKALGGDEIQLAAGTQIAMPVGSIPEIVPDKGKSERAVYRFPGGCQVRYAAASVVTSRAEAFHIEVPKVEPIAADASRTVTLPAGARELVPGSSWGTFTIACTIPIGLFMGLWMYRIRKGRIGEATVIGVLAGLPAVVVGNWVPGSPFEAIFSLTKDQPILALTSYGFIASVLPVWLLLCPRDYLSSFLKIGTVALIVLGVFVANPKLPCPAVNETFL